MNDIHIWDEIKRLSKQLSEEQLLEMNEYFVAEIKSKRKQRAGMMKMLLRKGDTVLWTNRYGSETRAEIIRVMKTNAKVRIIQCDSPIADTRIGRVYRVPMSGVTKYEEWDIPDMPTFDPTTGDIV
tara:strand:- start:4749 stop:5126 length:378 start_codon:yes stop_codon:yes gene_type:complete